MSWYSVRTCMFVCLAEVEAEESSSLKQLQALVSIACEYLGLWKILCDHQFHVIAGALTPVSFTQLLLSLASHCVCVCDTITVGQIMAESASVGPILPSDIQHFSYDVCLGVRGEIIRTLLILYCVLQSCPVISTFV